MSLTIATSPTENPISDAEAKAHLRVDHTDDDTFIGTLVDAATQYLDGPAGILGRALVTQTWDLYLDEWPANAIRIPLAPLASVTSINYVDISTEAETGWAATNYQVDTHSTIGWAVYASSATLPTLMDTINAVRVRFIAGYGAAAAVPAPIHAAIKLIVGFWYENRGDEVAADPLNIPGVRSLLMPYRVAWS